MKKATILYILLVISIFTSEYYSQDFEFSQYYANQLYLNPAFAGSKICPRINAGYRDQWRNISGTFVSQSIAYDQTLGYDKPVGFGLIISNDVAAKTLKTMNLSGIISYQIKLNRYYSIRAGFQATYFSKSIDRSKLIYGDQIDPRRGFVYTTNDLFITSNNTNNVDFSLGGLIFSDKIFLGLAVHHITQPNESLLQNRPSYLPTKYTVHGGANFYVGPKYYKNKDRFLFSPNIMYRQQGKFKQINLGMYIGKGIFTGGLWYRLGDAMILSAGIKTERYSIGYSYDITISDLSNVTGGTNEISLGYTFKCKKKRKRINTIMCPSN